MVSSPAVGRLPPTGLERVNAMVGWAVDRDVIAMKPCAGIKAPTVGRHGDRVLTDDELRLVWLAADKLGGPYAALVKLLVLTGAAARRGGVSELERGRS